VESPDLASRERAMVTVSSEVVATLALIDCITSEKSSHVCLDSITRQCSIFQHLHVAHHPSTASVTKAVVNPSDTQLDNATHLALVKVPWYCQWRTF